MQHKFNVVKTFSQKWLQMAAAYSSMLKFTIITYIIFILCNSTTYEWNIQDKYGSITQSTLAKAISDAKEIFNKPSNNDIIILIINNGTYNIGGNNSSAIDLSNIKPGDNGGRFIIKGQGMDDTILVFTDIYQAEIFGKDVYHTTIEDMHMTRNAYTVTQGTTENIDVDKSTIDISLHSGYPDPNSLLSPTKEPSGGGLFIRQYTNSKTDPHIYTNLSQIPWINASLVKQPNVWRFNLKENHQDTLSEFKLNEYIGVKAKHDGDTYHICGGNDIIFKNILYTQSSRGTLRCGVNNILFDNIKVLRSKSINGQTPCMSTNAGGPQLNQPGDPMAYNASVINSYFECTGDDSIAFFEVSNGSVYNTFIRDSFANGIRVNDTSKVGVCGQNITLVRSVLLNESGTYHQGCPNPS